MMHQYNMPSIQATRFLATTPMAPPASNGGPLYNQQAALPKLPVPTLEETLLKYLKSVKPLVSTEQYNQTVKMVEEFKRPGGQGEALQSRLLQRASELKQGWFIDWWNDWAYFGYRAPLPVNVSYFFVFRDDPKRMNQAARAASLITGALDYRKKLVE
jgi:carnitine O-acetyltransferase